jgi:hypothetical protein
MKQDVGSPCEERCHCHHTQGGPQELVPLLFDIVGVGTGRTQPRRPEIASLGANDPVDAAGPQSLAAPGTNHHAVLPRLEKSVAVMNR